MLDYRNLRFLFDKMISQEISEGEARGRAEEIVSIGRDFDWPKETILSRLIDKLGCTRDDAERMLREA